MIQRAKGAIWAAFTLAIEKYEAANKNHLDCDVVMDYHMGFPPKGCHKTDVCVLCGKHNPCDNTIDPKCIIVTDFISSQPSNFDITRRLTDYSKVVEIEHYLVVDLVRSVIIHHQRKSKDLIATEIHHDCQCTCKFACKFQGKCKTLTFKPPGLTVAAKFMFGPR